MCLSYQVNERCVRLPYDSCLRGTSTPMPSTGTLPQTLRGPPPKTHHHPLTDSRPHTANNSSPSLATQGHALAGIKRPLDDYTDDHDKDKSTSTVTKRHQPRGNKNKKYVKEKVEGVWNSIPEPKFEECYNLWNCGTSLKTSDSFPSSPAHPFCPSPSSFLRGSSLLLIFPPPGCSLTLVDRPLPACTDPYLLALLSDGPHRSAEATPDPTHTGRNFNSFHSLEWLGDSLLLHYLRTRMHRILGPIHRPPKLPTELIVGPAILSSRRR